MSEVKLVGVVTEIIGLCLAFLIIVQGFFVSTSVGLNYHSLLFSFFNTHISLQSLFTSSLVDTDFQLWESYSSRFSSIDSAFNWSLIDWGSSLALFDEELNSLPSYLWNSDSKLLTSVCSILLLFLKVKSATQELDWFWNKLYLVDVWICLSSKDFFMIVMLSVSLGSSSFEDTLLLGHDLTCKRNVSMFGSKAGNDKTFPS